MRDLIGPNPVMLVGTKADAAEPSGAFSGGVPQREAEELALAESIHADDSKGKGSGGRSSKQATIKTHRVNYYAATRIMGMEVEFDGGDAFPKARD